MRRECAVIVVVTMTAVGTPLHILPPSLHAFEMLCLNDASFAQHDMEDPTALLTFVEGLRTQMPELPAIH